MGALTLVAGKEQAVEKKRRISGHSLYEMMVAHKLQGMGGMRSA